MRILGVRQKDFVNMFLKQYSYFYFRLKVVKELLTKFKVNLEQKNTDLVQGQVLFLVVSLKFARPHQVKGK